MIFFKFLALVIFIAWVSFMLYSIGINTVYHVLFFKEIIYNHPYYCLLGLILEGVLLIIASNLVKCDIVRCRKIADTWLIVLANEIVNPVYPKVTRHRSSKFITRSYECYFNKIRYSKGLTESFFKKKFPLSPFKVYVNPNRPCESEIYGHMNNNLVGPETFKKFIWVNLVGFIIIVMACIWVIIINNVFGLKLI